MEQKIHVSLTRKCHMQSMGQWCCLPAQAPQSTWATQLGTGSMRYALGPLPCLVSNLGPLVCQPWPWHMLGQFITWVLFIKIILSFWKACFTYFAGLILMQKLHSLTELSIAWLRGKCLDPHLNLASLQNTCLHVVEPSSHCGRCKNNHQCKAIHRCNT